MAKKGISMFSGALLAAVFFFVGCKDPPTPETSPAPVLTGRALEVHARTTLFERWDEARPENKLAGGGWFESVDAPDSAKRLSADAYAMIDPKNMFTVLRVPKNGGDKETVKNSDYSVVVLKDGTAKANTKLEEFGIYQIQIVYKADASIPVKYVNPQTGVIDKNLTGLEIYAAGDAAAIGTEPLAAFEILKKPDKLTYDWLEPFNTQGLEVLAWYKAKTLAAGGIPIIAQSSDYLVDNKKYTDIMNQQTIPADNYPPTPIYIEPPASAGGIIDGQKTGSISVEFTVQIDIKPYRIHIKQLDGSTNIIGGVVTTTKYAERPKRTVTVSFQPNTSQGYSFNPESVKLVYKENVEQTPGMLGQKNTLDFLWSNAALDTTGQKIKTDSQVYASFSMPASEVVIFVEFVTSNTRLTGLKAGIPASSTNLNITNNIFGFSSNITSYTWVLLKDQNEFAIAPVTVADTLVVTATNADIENKGNRNFYIHNFDAGNDAVVSISVSNGGLENTMPGASERIYKITVKKFTANNEITYYYNGTTAGTGSPQTFLPPVAGDYEFSAWGAYGGNRIDYDGSGGNGFGGQPAKVSGKLHMDPASVPWIPPLNAQPPATPISSPNVVYIYVGEGGWAHQGFAPGPATWNGGGSGGLGGAFGAGQSGGGATSVSLTRGVWSDWQVLLDRILVAGGGGGYGHNNGRAGAAGGLVAQGGRTHGNWTQIMNDINAATGYGPTEQKNGYWTGASQFPGSGRGGQNFGIGGTPADVSYGAGWGSNGRGGGGGGYFGGECSYGWVGSNTNAGGGGGSSYVSGYYVNPNKKCVSYSQKSSSGFMVVVGCNLPLDPIGVTAVQNHYSGCSFTNAYMSELDDVWNDNQGLNAQDAHPIPDPFAGGLGPLGAKNRDGVLKIKYIP
ncbi:MAG: hypothetical protein LBG74_05910 [Spirochaetaceae bacterium]|jgi:hypothetical protein|nr:hypothetical protein [Spirochaetaceae bacterium]